MSEPQTSQPDPQEGEVDKKTATTAALELLKQLITLSSGVLVLSATFVQKLNTTNQWLLLLLGVSWLLLVASVFCGLQSMSAMVKGLTHPEFHWSQAQLRGYARASKYCFIGGIGLFVTFAFLLLLLHQPGPTPPPLAKNTIVTFPS